MRVTNIVNILIIFLFFSGNLIAQNEIRFNSIRVHRIIVSTDLETILSGSGSLYASGKYFNLLYEHKLKKRASILYGLEYQRQVSKIILNGQIASIYETNYYYAKSKYNLYIIPFNKNQHSSLNGVYLGTALKFGTATSDKYNYIVLSPGILAGTCFIIHKNLFLNVEFESDVYLKWRKQIDSSGNFTFENQSNFWMNLWLSIGYRF
jgi:hypothetical protein